MNYVLRTHLTTRPTGLGFIALNPYYRLTPGPPVTLKVPLPYRHLSLLECLISFKVPSKSTVR